MSKLIDKGGHVIETCAGGPMQIVEGKGERESPRMTGPIPYMRPGREAGGEFLKPKRGKKS